MYGDTKKQMQAKGEKVLASMPKDVGWRLRVWENIGWHYAIVADHISISEYQGRFHCLIGEETGTGGPWTSPGGSYKTPMGAAKGELAVFKNYMQRQNAVLSSILNTVEPKVEPKQGWGWPLNTKKSHYFVGGRSLCGKWGAMMLELNDNKHKSPDNCAECKRKREKRVKA